MNKTAATESSIESQPTAARRFPEQQRAWLKRFRNVHWIDASVGNIALWTGQALDAIHRETNHLI